jgi:hypothetical protein
MARLSSDEIAVVEDWLLVVAWDAAFVALVYEYNQ